MTSKIGKRYHHKWKESKQYLDNTIDKYEQGELPKEGLIAHLEKFTVMLKDIFEENLPTNEQDAKKD